MGVWDEQYWPSQEEVEHKRAEYERLKKQVQSVTQHIKTEYRNDPVNHVYIRDLSREQQSLEKDLGEIKQWLSHVSLHTQQERAAREGIDPTDARSLMTLLLGLAYKYAAEVRRAGGTITEMDSAILDAASLYVNYKAKAPAGKLAFVPAQVDH